MANEIFKLKTIDIKEISRTTHIQQEYIEYMIEKDFEKLKKLNALGFAKIISREYEIDLSDWCEEFKNYTNENNASHDDKKITVNPKISSYTQQETTKSKFFIFIGLILILIIVALFLMDFDDVKKRFFDNLPKKQTTTIEQNSLILETQQIQEAEQNNTLPIELKYMDDNKTDENISIEQNTTIMPIRNLDENTTKNELSVEFLPPAPTIATSAHFIPKRNLWVGIKNLDTLAKRAFSTREPFDINLSMRAIVHTGHGELTLQSGDVNNTYSTHTPLRFLIDNGEIRRLAYEEYIKINKGEQW